jgi:ribosome maturation factor RimP
VEDLISGRYFLEVSSPGIERPVQRSEDFLRFIGYRARIVLEPGGGRRRYKGVLSGMNDGALDIEVDGTLHSLDMDAIERAHLILDLDEYKKISEALPPKIAIQSQ